MFRTNHSVCLFYPKKTPGLKTGLSFLKKFFQPQKNGYSKSNLDFSIISLFYFLESLKYLGAYRAFNKLNQNIQKQVGFEDPLYFSRIFTKNMENPPSEYHKKKKD